MKTTSKDPIQKNLEGVLKRFLANKNTFSLTKEEEENLKNNLFELLSNLYDNHKVICIDINQLQVYETCYYTFTFESMVTRKYIVQKNNLADALVRFMHEFTDYDGVYHSISCLDNNNSIYQFNFKIS